MMKLNDTTLKVDYVDITGFIYTNRPGINIVIQPIINTIILILYNWELEQNFVTTNSIY